MKSNKDFKTEFKTRQYKWVLRLIKYIEALEKSNTNDVMGKQLLRSGTSILANYVEANSASSKKDYINFFTHALKSSNESKVWITLFRDLKKGKSEETDWLLKELIEISKIIASSIITMKRK